MRVRRRSSVSDSVPMFSRVLVAANMSDDVKFARTAKSAASLASLTKFEVYVSCVSVRTRAEDEGITVQGPQACMKK